MMDNIQSKSYRLYPVNYDNSNPICFRQRCPQRNTSNYNINPRPGNYQYPQNNNAVRPFLYNNDRNMFENETLKKRIQNKPKEF